MDPDTQMVDANMNASWKGKITLSTEYQEENTTIRQISSSDTNGMWGYKDKLTKIVIENKKSVKTAEDGGKVYGPYDESADGYGGVQSYVVCDESEENCTGYLQGTNGIKGNEDSRWLFGGFTKVIQIDGLANIDTSNVINMSQMFSALKLQELTINGWDTSHVTNISQMFNIGTLVNLTLVNFDLSHVTNKNSWLISMNLETLVIKDSILPQDCSNLFSQSPSFNGKNIIFTNVDTSHVTNMSSMFTGVANVQTLDLSSFDTINVTDMSQMFAGCTQLKSVNLEKFKTNQVENMSTMFAGCTQLESLDLSSFDTTNATDMHGMFGGTINLQTITFGPKFIHNVNAITSGMFGGCPAPERPTDQSWQDVSFD